MRAASAEEALSQVNESNTTPDLVIFDYKLPGNMTGLDIYRTISQKQPNVSIPGIIISGTTVAAHFNEFVESGLVYMTKPIDPDKLHTNLKNLL